MNHLERIGCKKRHRKKGGSLEEEEVLGLVRQAIKQLETQRRSATLSMISKLVRLRTRTLLSYPQVQQLLEEVETQRARSCYSTLEQGDDELNVWCEIAPNGYHSSKSAKAREGRPRC